MKIKLTMQQWNELVPLVRQADRSIKTLGLPLTIDNGNQLIIITAEDGVKIELE